jgi:hypothetical protein
MDSLNHSTHCGNQHKHCISVVVSVQPARFPSPLPSVHNDTRPACPFLNTPLNLCTFRACMRERCKKWQEICIKGLGDRSRLGSRGHRFAKGAVVHLEAALHSRDPLRPPHPGPSHPAPPHTARPTPTRHRPSDSRKTSREGSKRDLLDARLDYRRFWHRRRESAIQPHPQAVDTHPSILSRSARTAAFLQLH